jgi:hypothetical protein
LIQFKHSEQPLVQSPQKMVDRLGASAKKPSGFRKHRPTCEKGAFPITYTLKASCVVRIRSGKNGDDRARVDQDFLIHVRTH